VAAVVLAAGFSRRLGRPKQEIEIGGETLVERAVRLATEAGFAPVYVVSREAGQMAQAVVVLNEEAAEGMAASVRCGVRAAGDVDGVVVMACDQVFVRPEHLRELVRLGESVCGSEYAGRVGVPAYFPRAVFGGLMQLRGDVGARELLRGARSVSDEALAMDIDTEEDLRRLRDLTA
jgi:CTP:molybdopterin cytidylyltransferase MocA